MTSDEIRNLSSETKEICVYECVYEYGKVPPITYSYT